MGFAVIGLNQNTAPIEVRNRVAFSPSKKIDYIGRLQDLGFNEVVVLATCGRNETYIYCDNDHLSRLSELVDLLCEFFKFDDLKAYLYIKSDKEAIRHLFSVTSGFDSIVLGEDQILGQVKEAHSMSMDIGASSKIFNKLFREAITFAKRMKTQYKISENPLSIAYIGVKHVLDLMGGFEDKALCIIGIGEMGRLALEHAYSKAPRRILATNRNHKKVMELHERYPDLEVIDYAAKHQVMKEIDLLITATSSPHYIIKPGDIPEDRKVTILDLAMPVDVDPKIGLQNNVTLLTVDSLNQISRENERKRSQLMFEAQGDLDEAIEDFLAWMLQVRVDPIIGKLNDLSSKVSQDTYQYLESKLSLDCKERQLLNKMLNAALKRMVRGPILKLKSTMDYELIDQYLDTLEAMYE